MQPTFQVRPDPLTPYRHLVSSSYPFLAMRSSNNLHFVRINLLPLNLPWSSSRPLSAHHSSMLLTAGSAARIQQLRRKRRDQLFWPVSVNRVQVRVRVTYFTLVRRVIPPSHPRALVYW